MNTSRYSLLLFLILFSLFLLNCSSRLKVPMCDLQDLLVCSVSNTSEQDIEACVEAASGESCDLDSSDFDALSASLANPSDTSYVCVTHRNSNLNLNDSFIGTFRPQDDQTVIVDPFHVSYLADDRFHVVNSIQAALNLVSSGGTVAVCPGQYYENIQVQKNEVTVLGIAQDSDGTVLNPLSFGSVVSVHVTDFVMKNFTIENGFSDFGGGVFVDVLGQSVLQDQSILFENMIFRDNQSTFNGGAVSIRGEAQVDFISAQFLQNSSLNGGVFSINEGLTAVAEVNCERCEFNQNEAYTFGSVALVGPGNRFLLKHAEFLQNGLADLNLETSQAAVFLSHQAYFFSTDVNWGEGLNENYGSDIANLSEQISELDHIFLAYGYDLDDFVDPNTSSFSMDTFLASLSQSLQNTEWNNQLTDDINELYGEAFWEYDFSGIVESVFCNHSSQHNQCYFY